MNVLKFARQVGCCDKLTAMLNHFVFTELHARSQSLRSVVMACPMGECFNTITTMTHAAT
jgi:hypothetical protein